MTAAVRDMSSGRALLGLAAWTICLVLVTAVEPSYGGPSVLPSMSKNKVGPPRAAGKSRSFIHCSISLEALCFVEIYSSIEIGGFITGTNQSKNPMQFWYLKRLKHFTKNGSL